jgi:hypothetical protein
MRKKKYFYYGFSWSSAFSYRYGVSVALLLLLMLMLTTLLAGCGSSSPTAPATTVVPLTNAATAQPLLLDWQTRWLQGIPCKLPCWEGITPGQTDDTVAITILKKSAVVTDVHFLNWSKVLGEINWKWADGTEGGAGFYHKDSQAEHGKIFRLRPNYKRSFTLGDVIPFYGEPSHVEALAFNGVDYPGVHYGLRLIYLAQGFELRKELFSKDGSTKPVISLATPMDRVEFFDTTDSTQLVSYEWMTLQNWQGLKDFDFYCRAPFPKNSSGCSHVK